MVLLFLDPCLVDGAMRALSEFARLRLARLDGEHFPESVLFESARVCRRRPATRRLPTRLWLVVAIANQKTLIVQIDRQKLLVVDIPVFWPLKIPKKTGHESANQREPNTSVAHQKILLSFRDFCCISSFGFRSLAPSFRTGDTWRARLEMLNEIYFWYKHIFRAKTGFEIVARKLWIGQ